MTVSDGDNDNKLSILVVDDSKINLELIKALLCTYGHKVTCVENGEDAIVAFSEASFDVVLMDIQMPVMDGIEATEVIRRIEFVNNTRTPIIALTSSVTPGDQERYNLCGMDGLIGKPVNSKDLLASVSLVIAEFNKNKPLFIVKTN